MIGRRSDRPSCVRPPFVCNLSDNRVLSGARRSSCSRLRADKSRDIPAMGNLGCADFGRNFEGASNCNLEKNRLNST